MTAIFEVSMPLTLRCLAFLAILLASGGHVSTQPARPNVLFLIADDLNNDLGVYGAPVRSPGRLVVVATGADARGELGGQRDDVAVVHVEQLAEQRPLASGGAGPSRASRSNNRARWAATRTGCCRCGGHRAEDLFVEQVGDRRGELGRRGDELHQLESAGGRDRGDAVSATPFGACCFM